MTLFVVAAALAAWVSFWFVIPGSLRGIFELRLWQLRDQVVDEIFAGRYENPEQAKLFVSQLQLLLSRSKEISVGTLWLLRANDPSALLARAAQPLAGSSDDDEALLKEHAATLRRLLNHHARWETPSGWICCWLPLQPVRTSDIGRLLGLAAQDASAEI